MASTLDLSFDSQRKVTRSLNVEKYISFSGKSGCYGELPLEVLPNATDFTIEVKFSTTSTKNSGNNYDWGTIFGREIGGNWKNDFGLCVNDGKLCFWAEPSSGGSGNTRNTISDAIVNDGQIHKGAVVSSNGSIDLFCDGVKVAHTDNVNAKINPNYKILIAYNTDADSRLQMDLYEARLWNVARTEVFSAIDGTENGLQAWLLPTTDGLKDFSANENHATLYGNPAFNVAPAPLDLDTSRKLKNRLDINFDTSRKVGQRWRYENYGSADLILVEGTTLELDAAKFKTAFYQTKRVKCFDIPTTNEIWAKFDVYTTLSSRWRAYNQNSNGINGVCSQTDGQFDFWINDTQTKTFAGAIKNQLQAVLLHMISGSSAGVVEAWLDGEKLYTYTGNVNNGEDFEEFYLQSDGARTTFSNVIISNREISFDENATMPLDVQFDLKRRLLKIFDLDASFDSRRSIQRTLELDFDTQRKVVRTLSLDADTSRKVLRTVELLCDTQRKIPHNFYFDDKTFENVSISISEQQLTDQVSFTTKKSVDIMEQVKGQHLDYKFNMRVESTSQQISYINQNVTLTTCRCCSDIDQLLYTQVAYKLGASDRHGGFFVMDRTTGKTRTVQTANAFASTHIWKIASILKKEPVLQFDNFVSTVDIEQGGVTYQDLINEIFGWTSRIPHKLINVFIRDDKLYVIQRGHEQNTFDISDEKIANLVIKKSLVRTRWGATKGSAERTTGTSVALVLGNPIPSEEEVQPEPEPEPEPEPVLLTKTEEYSNGSRSSVTNYYSDGHTEKTTTRSFNTAGIEYNPVSSTTDYVYDSDTNLTATKTSSYVREKKEDGGYRTRKDVSFTNNEYETDEEGNKRLITESMVTFTGAVEVTSTEDLEQPGGTAEEISGKTVVHSKTQTGYETALVRNDEGKILGFQVLPTKKTVKPTPYELKQDEQKSPFTENLYWVEENGHKFIGGWDSAQYAPYVYQNGQRIEVVGWIESPTTENADTIALYDSTFPVAGTAYLREGETDRYSATALTQITNDLKWLNRKTQESVSLDIYDVNHVFDFNDKIIFNGNEYFLQSNQVAKDARIVNKQTLQLVRWY